MAGARRRHSYRKAKAVEARPVGNSRTAAVSRGSQAWERRARDEQTGRLGKQTGKTRQTVTIFLIIMITCAIPILCSILPYMVQNMLNHPDPGPLQTQHLAQPTALLAQSSAHKAQQRNWWRENARRRGRMAAGDAEKGAGGLGDLKLPKIKSPYGAGPAARVCRTRVGRGNDGFLSPIVGPQKSIERNAHRPSKHDKNGVSTDKMLQTKGKTDLDPKLNLKGDSLECGKGRVGGHGDISIEREGDGFANYDGGHGIGRRGRQTRQPRLRPLNATTIIIVLSAVTNLIHVDHTVHSHHAPTHSHPQHFNVDRLKDSLSCIVTPCNDRNRGSTYVCTSSANGPGTVTAASTVTSSSKRPAAQWFDPRGAHHHTSTTSAHSTYTAQTLWYSPPGAIGSTPRQPSQHFHGEACGIAHLPHTLALQLPITLRNGDDFDEHDGDDDEDDADSTTPHGEDPTFVLGSPVHHYLVIDGGPAGVRNTDEGYHPRIQQLGPKGRLPRRHPVPPNCTPTTVIAARRRNLAAQSERPEGARDVGAARRRNLAAQAERPEGAGTVMMIAVAGERGTLDSRGGGHPATTCTRRSRRLSSSVRYSLRTRESCCNHQRSYQRIIAKKCFTTLGDSGDDSNSSYRAYPTTSYIALNVPNFDIIYIYRQTDRQRANTKTPPHGSRTEHTEVPAFFGRWYPRTQDYRQHFNHRFWKRRR